MREMLGKGTRMVMRVTDVLVFVECSIEPARRWIDKIKILIEKEVQWPIS